jgi:hypothetical protein
MREGQPHRIRGGLRITHGQRHDAAAHITSKQEEPAIAVLADDLTVPEPHNIAELLGPGSAITDLAFMSDRSEMT